MLGDCARGADFLAFWDSLAEPQRRALVAGRDASVALQSRWEIERRVVATGETPYMLDSAGIDRFLAGLTERTSGPPPTWWADALRSARYHPSTGATSYEGMLTLRKHGVRKVLDGVTTIDEVKAATLADHV